MDPEKTLKEILDLMETLSYNTKHNEVVHKLIQEQFDTYDEWLKKGGFKVDISSMCLNWLHQKRSNLGNMDRR